MPFVTDYLEKGN